MTHSLKVYPPVLFSRATSNIFNHYIVVMFVVEYSLFSSLVLALCWSTLMHPHPGSPSSATRHEHRDVCTRRILYLLVCVLYLTQDQELQHRPTSFQTLVVKMHNAAFTLFIQVSTIFYAQPLSIKQANTANSLHSSCPSRLHPPEMIEVKSSSY